MAAAAVMVVGSAPAMASIGSAWTIQLTPNPKGGGLLAVSCTAFDACTAVGTTFHGEGGVGRTLAEQWDGLSWSIQKTPNPSGLGSLDAVSCTAADDCIAVGTTDYGDPATVAEVWDGATWSVQKTPNPDVEDVLYGVSCTGIDACVAVGVGSTYDGNTLAEAWDGSTWSVQQTPNPQHLDGL